MPLISVCLAVYNGEATLREALDSVRRQTFTDFELVVLDDGSSDASAQIAEEYGARVIRQANAGLGAGRKRLVEEATGEWIAFLDHDDIWTEDKLEKQVALLGPDVALVHSDCWYEYDDGRVVPRDLRLPADAHPFDHILPSNIVIASSAVFSRTKMLEAGNFVAETVRCSDWYGWFLLAPTGRFVHMPEKQVRYKVLATSLANAGLKFQDAKRFLLKDVILPLEDRLFKNLPARDQSRYHKMIVRDIGIAASTMAKFLHEQGRHTEAKTLEKEAIKLAPGVPRVWTRAIKARLKK